MPMLQRDGPSGSVFSLEDSRPPEFVILMTALGIAGHKGVSQENNNTIFCNSFHPVSIHSGL